MSYQTLAIKHRPTRFSQVIGQPVAVKTLSGMIAKQRVPPTVLISGPRSSGKTTLSRILARTINCQHPTPKGPCGQCNSCVEEHHPDIEELNASSDRGIDMVRRLSRVSRLAPKYHKRVFLIEEVHATTPQAHQAFLLTLEEPPPTCQFVLLTTDPQKLPDTVLARCSRITLQTPSVSSMTQWLIKIAAKENFKLSQDNATQLCQVSDQHPREALALLEQLICYADDGVLEGKTIDDCVTKVLGGSYNTNNAIIKAVLTGDIVSAIGYVIGVDNHVWLINSCVDMLDGLCTTKLKKERRWRNFDVGKYKTAKIVHCLKVFVKWQAKAMSFTIPAKTCLNLAIYEATL